MTSNVVGEVRAFQEIYQFKWIIENFSSRSENVGDKLISPVLTITTENSKYDWQVLLYPKGDIESSANYLSIFIYSHKTTIAAVSFSILDINNKAVGTLSFDKTKFEKEKILGFPEFVENALVMDPRNSLLINDKLTIWCEIKMDREIDPADRKKKNIIRVNNTNDAKVISLLELSREFEQLVENEKFSDFSIEIEGKTIRAHKCILAKRSEVCAAWFTTEKLQDRVTLEKIRYDVFKELLRFMYSGKVNGLDAIAVELCTAAKLYRVNSLVDLCEKYLIEKLNPGNALKALKIVHQLKIVNLKPKIIDFIVEHSDDFVDEPEFNIIGKLPAELLLAVLQASMRKKKE